MDTNTLEVITKELYIVIILSVLIIGSFMIDYYKKSEDSYLRFVIGLLIFMQTISISYTLHTGVIQQEKEIKLLRLEAKALVEKVTVKEMKTIKIQKKITEILDSYDGNITPEARRELRLLTK